SGRELVEDDEQARPGDEQEAAVEAAQLALDGRGAVASMRVRRPVRAREIRPDVRARGTLLGGDELVLAVAPLPAEVRLGPGTGRRRSRRTTTYWPPPPGPARSSCRGSPTRRTPARRISSPRR